MQLSTLFYTCMALLAFAGNSVLCRMALAGDNIDAASFSALRLFSGTVFLVMLLSLCKGKSNTAIPRAKTLQWVASLCLLIYMLAFSYAYLSLNTATGALILFAVVQLSMLLFSLYQGIKLRPLEYVGLLMALAGLVYLLLPGAETPNIAGFVLMLIAGIAWAGFTLTGKHSTHALTDTTKAFVYALPVALIWALLMMEQLYFNQYGVLLALLSGAITSGLGYYLWYLALPALGISQAAALQLLVPVIAAAGGVIFSGENLSLELILSSLMILGGIGLVIRSQAKK